ncbi:MAG: S1/P1 nuclease [Cyclobacteriaceae bacterium]
MKYLICLLGLTFAFPALSWGPTGHYTVGHIAEHHLNKKARKQIAKMLGNESLALVGVWMDEIRSDDRYKHTYDWHWVTVPDSLTYEQTEKNPNGDIIQTIERLVDELKSDTLSQQTEIENLKMLVHLVGDIHQPLHVGTGKDRGGNDIKVTWYWEDSNLHRVWDIGMIEVQKLSYTELAHSLVRTSKEEILQWQSTDVRTWANESKSLRSQAYDIPDKNMNYRYTYENYPTVKKRLQQAGIRLAGLLNEIYG